MSSRPVGRLLELEYRILELAASAQTPDRTVYGFQLARELADGSTNSLIGHGTLYKALGRLSTMGMLEWTWEADAVSESAGRPRRRLYAITGEGEVALRSRPTAPRVVSTRPVTA
ncbi:MAG: helix-turn-helix transcriptional regulator [Pseudolysinimonas sp.]